MLWCNSSLTLESRKCSFLFSNSFTVMRLSTKAAYNYLCYLYVQFTKLVITEYVLLDLCKLHSFGKALDLDTVRCFWVCHVLSITIKRLSTEKCSVKLVNLVLYISLLIQSSYSSITETFPDSALSSSSKGSLQTYLEFTFVLYILLNL